MSANQIVRGVLSGAMLFATTLLVRGQGDLTPPVGSPAPTMRTLDQIYNQIGANGRGDTRIDILTLPAGGAALHQITAPGSYYLTTNIVGYSGGIVAINVHASKVSIDLNGFTLSGNGSTFCGIWLNGALTNITIRNGTIAGWGNSGIYADAGTAKCRFERLTLSRNIGYLTNPGNGLGGGTLINASQVVDCLVEGNSSRGIYLANDCLVDRCQAFNNGSDGISVQDQSIVRNCTSSGNAGSGIICANKSRIENNIACTNASFGVFASGQFNRIDGNQAIDNTDGIGLVSGQHCNLIVRNMAKNADQYRDPYVNIHETMNAYGPIQRLGDGPIGSGEVTANGWDNFELLSL